MTLRNPSSFSAWKFFLEAPDGREFFLTEHTLHRLTDLVIRQLSEFEKEKPGFTAAARAEAAGLKYDWNRYINLAIQHQICLRTVNSVKEGLCWLGAGDKIHEFMKGVDILVSNSPGPLRSIGEGVTKVFTRIATGKPQKKFGGCSSCGGRRTFSANDSNLGRVAKINKPN